MSKKLRTLTELFNRKREIVEANSMGLAEKSGRFVAIIEQIESRLESLGIVLQKELNHGDLEFSADSCDYCKLVRKILSLLGIQLCSRCSGTGIIAFIKSTPLATCHKCKGTGIQPCKTVKETKK